MHTVGKKPVQAPPEPVSSAPTNHVAPMDGPRRVDGVCFLDQHLQCEPSQKSKMPCVDEAIVLTEVEIYTRRDTFTPRVGDPLIVRGRGEEGAKISIFNADMKGWPKVGEAVVQNGEWNVEIHDVTKFARGDRVVVTAHERGKSPSEGVLQETVPFTERTHIQDHYHDNRFVSRTTTVTQSPDGPNADDRPPYFDLDRVDQRPRIDRGGIRIDLQGVCKAVPPYSKLTLNGSTVEAKKDGSFELTLRAGRPGETYDLTVEDVHGRKSIVPIEVPSMIAEGQSIVDGTQWSGNELMVAVQTSFCPGDKMVVRSPDGELRSLTVQRGGWIQDSLGCIEPNGMLEIGLETQGIRLDQLVRVGVRPPGDGPALVLLDQPWNASTLADALEEATHIRQEGGALNIPAVHGLPPYGRIDVVRGDRLAYQLHADECGVVQPSVLEKVQAGEELQFLTFDAGGRRLGSDIARYCAPATGETTADVKAQRAADNASLCELAALIGTGCVGLSRGGESTHLHARLQAPEHRAQGICGDNPSGRIEISGTFDTEQMPEAKDADRYDSAQLTVVDWDTNVRNMVFELYLGGRQQTPETVRLPLPFDRRPPKIRGEEMLPDAAEVLSMLPRAVAFASLLKSVGAGPGDKAYDGALRVARSLLYALDRIATTDAEAAPGLREQAQAAVAALGAEEVDASKFVPGTGTEGVTPKPDGRNFWRAVDRQQGGKSWQIR